MLKYKVESLFSRDALGTEYIHYHGHLHSASRSEIERALHDAMDSVTGRVTFESAELTDGEFNAP